MEKNHTNAGNVENISGPISASVDIRELTLEINAINLQTVVTPFSICHTTKYITTSIMEKNPTNVQNVASAFIIHWALKDVTEFTLERRLTNVMIVENRLSAA